MGGNEGQIRRVGSAEPVQEESAASGRGPTLRRLRPACFPLIIPFYFAHVHLHKQTQAWDRSSWGGWEGSGWQVGGPKKLIFPVAFWHLCPWCTSISIKCSPWGTNNNKQLLVDALYQHVPFGLSPLLNSHHPNTFSSRCRAQPDLEHLRAFLI